MLIVADVWKRIVFFRYVNSLWRPPVGWTPWGPEKWRGSRPLDWPETDACGCDTDRLSCEKLFFQFCSRIETYCNCGFCEYIYTQSAPYYQQSFLFFWGRGLNFSVLWPDLDSFVRLFSAAQRTFSPKSIYFFFIDVYLYLHVWWIFVWFVFGFGQY